MYRNLDNQNEQADRHHVSVMQRLLGVEGEEEHFARLELECVAAEKAPGRRTGARSCAPLHEVPEVRNAT